MDFADARHNVAELAFQGAEELEPGDIVRPDLMETLAKWQNRADPHSSGADLLCMDDCPHFSITYQGEAGEYWPSESLNDVSEILIRSFLYRDGICALTDEHIRLYRLKYSLMALAGDEYVLVCPYLTAAENISGIVVVSTTKVMHH